MRYNLRTFLMVMTALGVGAGVFIRLKNDNPQALLSLLYVMGTIVPFALAVLTVIVVGARGSRRGNQRLIGWGAVLLMAPIVLLTVLYNFPNSYSLLSNYRLTSSKFAGQVDNPQVWMELSRRVQRGDLSRADVDAAMKSIVANLASAAKSGGGSPRQHLPWAGQFIAAAQGANLISNPVLVQLFDAYNGQPSLRADGAFPNQDGWRCTLNIEYGSPFARGLGTTWTIGKVLVDGREAKVISQDGTSTAANGYQAFTGSSWTAHGSCLIETPGEHEIEVQVEVAYPVGTAGGNGFTQSDPRAWPKALKRQTLSAKATVTTDPEE